MLKLFLKLGNASVLKLRHACEIIRTMCRLKFDASSLKLFLNLGRALHRRFFRIPDLLKVSKFFLQDVEFRLDILTAFRRRVIRLFFQCFAFDLELNYASLQAIHCFGLRVNLNANARRCLINQVDGLVWQLPIADIAVR